MGQPVLVLDIPDSLSLPGCNCMAMGPKRCIHFHCCDRNLHKYYERDTLQKRKVEGCKSVEKNVLLKEKFLFIRIIGLITNPECYCSIRLKCYLKSRGT